VRVLVEEDHRFERGSKRAANTSGQEKINFSTVFAGQAVGIKEVHDDIWLVNFMDYDLGYFDLETRVLEPLENPFGPKVLPMS
jgi:putative transposase